jgi:hypothetical protein
MRGISTNYALCFCTGLLFACALNAHRCGAAAEDIVRGILTENGDPAANIKVSLVNSAGRQLDPVYTDKEGLYTFHGVNHSDRYVLRAWVSAEQPPIDFPIIFTGKAVDVWPIEIRGSSAEAALKNIAPSSPASRLTLADAQNTVTALSSEEVQNFVSDYWKTYEKGDLEKLVARYANTVDYYDNGNRGKSFIAREKARYLRYFTKRTFRVTHMDVFDTLTPNRKSVRFDFDYSVSHKGLPKVKHSTEVWTLEKIGDQIKITNCKSDIAKA